MKRRWALAIDETLDPIEIERRGERRAVKVEAVLQRGSEAVARIMLCNLSRYGFMAEGSGRVEIGEMLVLESAGVAANVHIAWALAGRIGGEFVTPLSATALAKILAEHKSHG